MQLIVLQACWANVRERRFWARPKSRSSWLMAWCWCFTDCCGELCADAFQFDREKLTNMLQEEHDQLHQLLEKYKEKLLKIGVRSHSLSSVLPFSYVASVTDWVCDVRSRSAETVITVKLSKMTNGSWRRWWTTQVDDKVGHLTADTAFLELWHNAIFEVRTVNLNKPLLVFLVFHRLFESWLRSACANSFVLSSFSTFSSSRSGVLWRQTETEVSSVENPELT